MSDTSHTTIATWVMPILGAIESFCDASNALKKAGIDAQCIQDSNQRVAVDKMRTLWEVAEQVSGDDCIGLEAIKYISPTSFHAITYAHHASSTMRESLERLQKFSSIISTAVGLDIFDENDEVVVKFRMAQDAMEPSFHAIDAFMALTVEATQTLLNSNENSIRNVKLKRDKPRDSSRHEAIFNCPIQFNSDIYEIRLAKQFVDKVVPTGNAELVRINEQVLAEYLSRFNKSDIVASVYNALIELMPHGEPTREKVAAVLGTSSRSLHRKLNELDTSYKIILDDTRKHLAMQYIKQSDLSITTITYQLGFLDSSSFSRSFKRWTGSSPSEYRKNIIK
jgi:AraC-like DNA-binding protein